MKEDITRQAMKQAAHHILAAAALLRVKIPFGPTHVQLTPAELRHAWGQAAPNARTRLLEELGYEKLLEVLGRQNGPPTY